LEGFECADPYVERLLEGFAFLAARVQLKVDADFPRFTQHLLEMVYPHYLAPTPSMVVAQFQPDLTAGALNDGFPIPRDSRLRSLTGKGDLTPCEYRTAHDLTLWPLQLTRAEYLGTTAAVAALDVPMMRGVKAGIRLGLRTTGDIGFDKLSLDRLPLYLRGGENLPLQLYEQLLGNGLALAIRSTQRSAPWQAVLDKSRIRRLGFEDEQALLPRGSQSFQGYRLLHEYFAFPERYLFVELAGLAPAVRRCNGNEIEIVVLLNHANAFLEDTLSKAHFALFCSPAINLFPKRLDRIHLSDRQFEYHLVPDRTRPMDFEVHGVAKVVGHGVSAAEEREFLSFYASHDLTHHGAYYTLHRRPRLSTRQFDYKRNRNRNYDPRSRYIGSEVFIALVDAEEAPYHPDLRQLAISALCTNRDLPLHMPVGQGETDFTLESGAPWKSIRCLAGPSPPRPSWAQRDVAWRLISHLSLNYLSLLNQDDGQGALALRDLLMLYGDIGKPSVNKQIDGVRKISATPVTRRLPIPGPIAFGRGLEITLTCDESAFEGNSVFLLGAVLEQFFGRYVSLNSFTQTVVKTLERDEIMRWPTRAGRRLIL
jgi:type VI secretion system protein ImpG